MTPVGGYRAGGSPLHRLPALAKVLLFLAWAIVAAVFSDPVTSAGMAGAALMLLVSVLPAPKPTLKGLFFIVVVAALAAAYQVYRGDYGSAIDIAGDIVGLFALALTVTTSTPTGELLDLATTAARPFRRVIPPAIPGVMFAVLIRVIPEISSIMAQTREAAKARGVRRSPRAFVVPNATRTIGFALDLGAALHARGIGDEARADAKPPRRGRSRRR